MKNFKKKLNVTIKATLLVQQHFLKLIGKESEEGDSTATFDLFFF
jgi:hypothetical protein